MSMNMHFSSIANFECTPLDKQVHP